MRYYERTQIDSAQAAILAEKLDVSQMTARLLLARGIETAEEAERFFHPAWEDLYDPFAFDAMEEVTERIAEEIDAGGAIAIYADYDCDGVNGAAILSQCLEAMGATTTVYIPDRFKEGYGTNAAAFEALCDEHALIITVDCGIRSVEDVALAQELGVDVIILDHHECAELPDTPYILNPKRPGEQYPGKQLCGAGVAFQLARALIGEHAHCWIDLAAVATIADMVELTGENRAIAWLGMQKLREDPAPGYAALAACAGIDLSQIKSYGVSFMLAPRINAAGRMEHARVALSLLTTQDESARMELATHLEQLNAERQRVQREVANQAAARVKEPLCDARILLVSGVGWDKGVVGLAATVLADRFNRPAVVFSEENGLLTGSARSIPGINLYELLASQETAYKKFGGHAQAAGLTMRAELLDEVRSALNASARETLPDEAFMRTVAFDFEVSPEEATLEAARELVRFEPFGEGNPQPVLLMRKVRVARSESMGKAGAHARFVANDRLSCAYFFHAPPPEKAEATLIGTLDENAFRGNSKAQFVVRNLLLENSGFAADLQTELEYMRSFLAEARMLGRLLQKTGEYKIYKQSAAWADALKASVQSSPLGTLAVVGSAAGARAWEALHVEGLMFCPLGVPEDTAENAVALTSAGLKYLHNYREVFACGALRVLDACPQAHVLLTAGLYRAYLKTAEAYYVPPEDLGVFLYACQQTKGSFDAVTQLMQAALQYVPGGTLMRMWYAINVFLEQKLIEMKKSDKIHINYLRDESARTSATQCAFQRLLKGE